jgi:bidirectional [NiFe] hydrogenase diaphorase subunit
VSLVRIRVDGKDMDAPEGSSLLQVCLENDIYIPNLCHVAGIEPPPASCRLCFVEIEGYEGPVTACTTRVTEGMVAITDSPGVRRLQRAGLQLLLSVHRVDCSHCPANKRCELQKMARFLKVGLKPKHLEPFLKDPDRIEGPGLVYYPNRCVLCGRCVRVCRSEHDLPLLTFARRGFDTLISFYGEQEASPPSCDTCLACVRICPVSALSVKGPHESPPNSHPHESEREMGDNGHQEA